MIRWLAIALIAAAGCGDGTCKKRVDQMQARLDRTADWPIGAGAGVELVEAPAARASTGPGAAVELSIGHDGALRRWGSALEIDRLRIELAAMDGPRALRLSIDRRAPIEAVRAVADAFPDRELQMVVRLAGVEPMPAPVDRVKKVIDSIQDSAPSERATAVAARVEAAVGECAAATEVFGRMATDSASRRLERLRRDLPAAVRACGCRSVDVPMLEGLLLATLGAYDEPRGWIELDRARLATAANTAALL